MKDAVVVAGGLLIVGGYLLSKLIPGRFTFPPLGGELHVTSPFGPRPSAADPNAFHAGVDLRAAVGTEVFAVDDGEIIGIERATSAGNIVRYKTKHGRISIMHLSTIDVSLGDFVRGGDVIAHSGATGQGVTGPHLHLEVRPLPGFGAVDPAPYFL